jgi:hypothetical protein
MGLGNFLKKKLEGDPAKRQAEREHKTEVKKAHDEAYNAAEIVGAKKRGVREGYQAGQRKQSSGILGMMGAAAEGAVYGINKGAETFNNGIGLNDFAAQKGNSDLFGFAPQPKTHRIRHKGETRKVRNIRRQRERIEQRHKKHDTDNYVF